MKRAFTTSFANYIAATILILVPFHAFLTVWGSTFVGHYTALRLWDDLLLGVFVVLVMTWLVRDKPLRQQFYGNLFVRLIGVYALLTLALGIISYARGDVTAKALAYGVLVNLRYLVWFVGVALLVQRNHWLQTHWRRVVLIPAALVVIFAVLQFTVLPHAFLSHFGYNTQTTIAPIETINHNDHYIRVESTLRGANPLGAYIVLVVSFLAVVVSKQRQRLALCAVLGVLTLIALYATGSRSAWIGSVLAVAVVGWLRLRTRRSKVLFGSIGLVIIIIAGVSFLAFRNNTGLENALLHTQKHSAVATSSNAAHASALKSGVKDVVRQPFGDGPGTAGPASVYNGSHAARIAEDYFVQIAQETGWLGLGLLLSIFILIGRELYRQYRTSPLALVLLASLVGLMFVNLLSHAWVDDTLSYIWWGLVGIALARSKEGMPSEV